MIKHNESENIKTEIEMSENKKNTFSISYKSKRESITVGLIIEILRKQNMTFDEAENVLNKTGEALIYLKNKSKV